jgi:hypothetical protein
VVADAGLDLTDECLEHRPGEAVLLRQGTRRTLDENVEGLWMDGERRVQLLAEV